MIALLALVVRPVQIFANRNLPCLVLVLLLLLLFGVWTSFRVCQAEVEDIITSKQKSERRLFVRSAIRWARRRLVAVLLWPFACGQWFVSLRMREA